MPTHDAVPVKMTALDHLLSPEQATQAQAFAQALASLREQTQQQLHQAGLSLDTWIAPHPLESRIRTVLLQPLHSDALALLGLFDRLGTRLGMFLPAPSLPQFLAGLELQNADIQARDTTATHAPVAPAAAMPDAPAAQVAAVPDAPLLGSVHMALSRSHMALSLSAGVLRDRQRSNGHLPPGERDAMDAIHTAEASVREAMAKVEQFRRQAAMQDASPNAPGAPQ